jgi:hypothetical protein
MDISLEELMKSALGSTKTWKQSRKEKRARQLRAAEKKLRKKDRKDPARVQMHRNRKEEERAQCETVEWLMRWCERDGECLVWLGPWAASFARALPEARAGHDGYQLADRAMWKATRGRYVLPNNWLERTCGRLECIEPTHLIETNQPLARIRRAGWLPSSTDGSESEATDYPPQDVEPVQDPEAQT